MEWRRSTAWRAKRRCRDGLRPVIGLLLILLQSVGASSREETLLASAVPGDVVAPGPLPAKASNSTSNQRDMLLADEDTQAAFNTTSDKLQPAPYISEGGVEDEPEPSVPHHYSYGMMLAGRGELERALGYLRATVRQYPDEPLYQNDLGVVEMRLGLLHKARRRFLASLRANASFEVGRENLQELESFLIKDRRESRATWDPAKRQLHRLQPLPRLSLDDLQWPWNAEYRELRAPFILTGAMRGGGGWDLDRMQVDSLAQEFPDARVDFYPHSLRTEDVRPLFHPLAKAVQQLHHPTAVYQDVDASEPGTYIQWNLRADQWPSLSLPPLPPVFHDPFNWMQECFPDATNRTEFLLKTHWLMVLSGEKDAGMFNHMDTLRTSSWQAQVQGSKRWHLCGPEQSDHVYGPGEVDMFQPNYVRHPKTKAASCFQDDVSEGEMLFYPEDYWHQTRLLTTPSTSVSGSLLTRTNWRLVFEELRRECDGSEARIFLRSDALCHNIEACERRWEAWVKEEQQGLEVEEEEEEEEEKVDGLVGEEGKEQDEEELTGMGEAEHEEKKEEEEQQQGDVGEEEGAAAAAAAEEEEEEGKEEREKEEEQHVGEEEEEDKEVAAEEEQQEAEGKEQVEDGERPGLAEGGGGAEVVVEEAGRAVVVEEEARLSGKEQEQAPPPPEQGEEEAQQGLVQQQEEEEEAAAPAMVMEEGGREMHEEASRSGEEEEEGGRKHVAMEEGERGQVVMAEVEEAAAEVMEEEEVVAEDEEGRGEEGKAGSVGEKEATAGLVAGSGLSSPSEGGGGGGGGEGEGGKGGGEGLSGGMGGDEEEASVEERTSEALIE